MPIALPVLFAAGVALSSSPPTAADTASAEVSASASGGGFRQGATWRGWRADGAASLTLYPRRPLTDDGSPPSLLAYLQRADPVTLSFSGGGLDGTDSDSGKERINRYLVGSVSTLFHLGGVVLGGRVLYERLSTVTIRPPASDGAFADTQRVRPSVTFGWRWRSLQLDASYRFTAFFDNGVVRPPQWGAVEGRAQWVPANERVYLRATGYSLAGGGGGSGYVEAFPLTRLGIWLSAFAEKGQIYSDSNGLFLRYGGEAGVGWWMTWRVELVVSGALSAATQIDVVPATDVDIDGRANLGLKVRIP